MFRTEELSENVEFYSKNKFEKWLSFVGFIIRMYHNARSPERHICLFFSYAYFWPQQRWDKSPESYLLFVFSNTLSSGTRDSDGIPYS